MDNPIRSGQPSAPALARTPSSRRKNCQADSTQAKPRRYRTACLRVLSLVFVHCLIGVHILHFRAAGRTLSPVEPSEATATLELGQVNAGFVLLLVTIISTLIFGRFFCGWACHMVALQDGCSWLLKRCGFRPRPLQVRLLRWVPAFLAVYVFVWPLVLRSFTGSPLPAFSSGFVTSRFWASFPGLGITALTFLVCGGLAVVVLGNKGFCTYVCPYGSMFGLADRFSAYGIVKTDSCVGCAKCTAACSSNVVVHQELITFGAVVNSGCMKCLDCVSVCPSDGLRLERRPKVEKPAANARYTKKKYDWTIGEEVLGLFVWGITTLILRGLYDCVPLLLAACLGVLTAVGAVSVGRALANKSHSLPHGERKTNGRFPPGRRMLVAGMAGWCLFLVHCEVVQWHRYWGRWNLERTGVTWPELLAGATIPNDPQHRLASASAAKHFRAAKRLGLVDSVEIETGLAWCAIMRDDYQAAENYLQQAISLDSDPAQLQKSLGEFRNWQRQERVRKGRRVGL